MLSLSELEKRCNLERDADERIRKGYRLVKDRFEAYGIQMSPDADFMFSNHVLCVVKRTLLHEFIEEVPEELFQEVSSRSREIALSLIAPLFEEQSVEPNTTEILMLATHIEVAIALPSEGESA